MSRGEMHAVIMAGGSGTRFWPASRAARPKQLLPLGDGRTSLLAATVRRIAPLVPLERVIVVTGQALTDATKAELPGLPSANLLAEPAPRNTAPCIGWATRTVLARDPDALVAVLPSDQHVIDERAFVASFGQAMQAARARTLATIGITPSRPDTGFGYIETGALIAECQGTNAREVVRFVEKPDLARARTFLESGRFLWNSGMFFFRAAEMNAAVAKHMPELSTGLDAIEADPLLLAKIFPGLPSISVDYGIVERVAQQPGHIAVVPADFGWSDVGSWESAWELSAKDAEGNALPEGTIAVDARRNLVRSTANKTVALVGVHDLVVVETEDALLVMPRERAQDVRVVVEALKSSGRTHRT